MLIATAAAVLLLTACVGAAGGTSSSSRVIAYESSPALARQLIYVTGPGGMHEVAKGQDPSVAPDGRMISASAPGGFSSVGPALTLYTTAGRRLHSFLNARVIAIQATWSPDSRYLAVLLQSNVLLPTGATELLITGLVVIDTRKMTARTVASGDITGASFAPSGPDRLVYGQALSQQIAGTLNLYTVRPDGSDRRQLTTDGQSLRPLWTARGIVYDRETPRGGGAAPASELWLLHGGHSTQLTHLTTPPLGAALVPVAASANGDRLIAEDLRRGLFSSLAIQVSPRDVRALGTRGTQIRAAGISLDGRTVLVDRGGLFNGVVETVPFAGGQPSRIASGELPAWNG